MYLVEINSILRESSPKIVLNAVGSYSFRSFRPTHSFVCLEIDGKQLVLASNHCAQTYPGDTIKDIYEELQVHTNVNLMSLPHGDDDDTYDKTMPRFLAMATKIHTSISTEGSVVLNCNNGRSRTGSVAALYLMISYNLNADDAIDIISSALEARGIKSSIDLKSNKPNASYGDWLRSYDPTIPKPVVLTLAAKRPIRACTMNKENEFGAKKVNRLQKNGAAKPKRLKTVENHGLKARNLRETHELSLFYRRASSRAPSITDEGFSPK